MVRNSLVGIAAAIAVCAGSTATLAQVGTAFTYQGQLKESGAAVNGTADMQFSLWTAASGGSQIGSTVTNLAVAANGGLLTTSVDFGVNPYTANQALYLQISVRTPAGSGSYVPMTSRQRLTASPFSAATRGISVDGNGNAAIGSLAEPFVKFKVVADDPAFGTVRLMDDANDGDMTFDGGTDGGAGIKYIGPSTGMFSINSSTAPNMLNLLATGNIGIGTTNPSRKLHVVGGAVYEGSPAVGTECMQIWGNDGTAARRNTFFGDGSNGSTFTVGFPQVNTAAIGGNTNHDFWLGGFGGGGSGFTPRITIKSVDSGGNVGIGTTSPAAGVALHVRQATNNNGVVRIDSGSSAAQYSIVGFADRGNQIWSAGLRPDGMFGIDRDGINTMLQIDQTGRIGMGGAVPTVGRQINVIGGAFCTGSVWTNACDKNLKEGFVAVNPEEVLNKVANMNVTTWRYKGTDKMHMGPTAQDFRAAFGLGENDTSIGTVDADGVSLAAIKGLNAKLEAKQAEFDALKARLEKLEALMICAAK